MFDFDTLLDRNGTGALKWDRRSDAEKAAGIVPMSVADMEFRVAPCVEEAVMRAAKGALYGYTDPDERYFAAVKHWMRVRHGWDVQADSVCPIYGVVPALSVAIRAFTQPGDGVIVQAPVYYPFGDMIVSNGRRVEKNALLVDGAGRYTMNFDELEALARKPDTKLMLLCSPHNPVGRVWTADELTRVRDICRAHGVIVVSDEIHFDLILQGRHTVYATLAPESIVLTAPSKTFNIPGLQLANAVIADPNLRNRFFRRMRADGFSNISHFGYAATVAAYEKGEAWVDALCEYLKANFAAFRAFFQAEFPNFPVTPLEGTYLAWVNFRALGARGRDLEALTRGKCMQVIDEGFIFGPEGDGYERFNIALPRQELQKALARLKQLKN